MLIAVLSQKGVVCKSTTTVHLADLDLQQTSIVWLAAADGFSIPCRAIPSDSDSVLVQLPPLVRRGRRVVGGWPRRAVRCDPGRNAGRRGADHGSTRRGRFAVGCGGAAVDFPGPQDPRGRPDAVVYLYRATKGTLLLTEVREVLAWLEGFRALGQASTQRQALSDCFAQGGAVFEPGTGPPLEAAGEYGRLFAELLNP